MQVLKFGGTSVGRPERMHAVAQIITRDQASKIVVLSALSGTTNALVGIGESLAAANKAEAQEKIEALRSHYEQFILDLLTSEEKRTEAQEIINEHFEFLLITLRISYNEALQRDILAQGELMSTKLFTLYLQEQNIKAALLPALDFMRTNEDGEPDITFSSEKTISNSRPTSRDSIIHYTRLYL